MDLESEINAFIHSFIHLRLTCTTVYSILAGASPIPHWGIMQRSPDPVAGFKGPTSRGGEGEETGEEGRGYIQPPTFL